MPRGSGGGVGADSFSSPVLGCDSFPLFEDKSCFSVGVIAGGVTGGTFVTETSGGPIFGSRDGSESC